ncbi:MAG: alpha/beta hydrolase [Cyclobacteriaceae bacterium]|nr:alpha/beta hydrolase [Cyclobacteriaceae bacterium]
MGQFLILLIFLFGTVCVNAQSLYIKTFGNPADRPIIYLHGGPGGSMIDFEVTTAEKLAGQGFFIIAYDRRGEGRSEDDNAQFTYEQTLSDLNDLYDRYNLKSATLLGHSFGGIVGTLYADKYPEKTDRLVLAGTPVSLQESFKTILQSVTTIAESREDSALLQQVNMVKNFDPSSIYYSSGCFMLAMQSGLYTAKNPNTEATELYTRLQNNEMMKNYTSFITSNNYKTVLNPTMGFWKNESYTLIDISEKLRSLDAKGVTVYGIYGKEDGLFDTAHINIIQDAIGYENRFAWLDNCSHGVFIDQQEVFLDLLKNWIR